jgi:hypothetical protein
LRVPCDDPPLNVLGLISYAQLTQDRLHRARDPTFRWRKPLPPGSLVSCVDHVDPSS